MERWVIKTDNNFFWTGKYQEHCWNRDISCAKIYNDLRSAWKVIEKRRKEQQWLNNDIRPEKIILKIVNEEQLTKN